LPLYRATTAVLGEPAAHALSEALDGLDPAPLASEVHDHDDGSGLWDAGGLFDGRPDPAGLALLARLHAAPDIAVARVDERDWVAQVQAELTPVEAGRFIVHGSHDRARVAPGRIGLEIEAAQAFGTGHHATTQGCLAALDRLVREGRVATRIADIGGGTGVLAMAAVSVWPATAVAGDIDPVATATARANASANGLGQRIRCVTAAGFAHPVIHGAAPFELIFANILAAPLKRLAPGFAAHGCPGGFAILSGILARQAPGVLAVFRGWGWQPEEPVRIGEWTTLVLRRR
jgi:ribosomal protein L11 methyltransferase